jgi:hypothetical protein
MTTRYRSRGRAGKRFSANGGAGTVNGAGAGERRSGGPCADAKKPAGLLGRALLER